MEQDLDTLGDIYRERASYLLNTDEMMEEMVSQIQSGTNLYVNVGFPRSTGTICCGALIDMDAHQESEMQTRERFPICSSNCGIFLAE